MYAIRGIVTDGLIVPRDTIDALDKTNVIIVFTGTPTNQTTAELLPANCTVAELFDFCGDDTDVHEWLDMMDKMITESSDEDLSTFPKQNPMKNPEDYPWFS